MTTNDKQNNYNCSIGILGPQFGQNPHPEVVFKLFFTGVYSVLLQEGMIHHPKNFVRFAFLCELIK